ncbi:MAG: redoxin domain-containing protein [Bacillota bacterium]
MTRYPRYKRVTSAITLLLWGLWFGYVLLWPNNNAAAGAGIALGAPAPDFELKTVDGQVYKLSDLKGQAVMLNFFATWCPPCRAEMPLLEETYKEYKDQGFIILAINLDESDVAITAFQQKMGITFPIVVDKGDHVSRRYDIVPLPTTYFVDRNGIVQGKWTGEIRKTQLLDLLKKIL